MAGPDQLHLAIVEPSPARLERRLHPMRASDGDGPFDDPAYLFEPWWPGLRTILVWDAGRLRAVADELADPLVAFPELTEVAESIDARQAIVDGWLLVIDEATRRPDPALLRRRLLDPLVTDGCAAFVATDLLALGDVSLTRRAFHARRALLETLVRQSDRCAVSRGIEGQGHALAAAIAPLGFAGLSARRLDARYRSGAAGDAWVRLSIDAEPREEQLLPPLLVFSSLPLG